MGLFSSRIKTFVDTAVQRVIEDKDIPNPHRQAMMESILHGSDIVDSMSLANQSALAYKMDSMFRYAKRSYPLGLPKGKIYNNRIDRYALRRALENWFGRSVNIEYAFIGGINYTHVLWDALHSSKGYQPESNTLQHPLPSNILDAKDSFLYLHDMEVKIAVPHGTSIDPNYRMTSLGDSPKRGKTRNRKKGFDFMNSLDIPIYFVKPQSSHTQVQDSATVYFEYKGKPYSFNYSPLSGYNNNPLIPMGPDEENGVRLGSFEIPLHHYDKDGTYLQVRYTAGTHVGFLTYRLGTNVPLLDNLVSPQATQTEFFPRIYFRYQKRSLKEWQSQSTYQVSKKICKKLGLDYAEIIDAINSNPDAKDIEQAMLVSMVPANTQNQAELMYLHHFFKNLSALQGQSEDTSNSLITGSEMRELFGSNLGTHKESARYSFELEDNWTRIQLNYLDIRVSKIPASIGSDGTYVLITEEDRKSNSSPATANSGGLEWTRLSEISASKVHRYRKQISPGICEEVSVYGLEIAYQIGQNMAKQGSGTDNILLIPLNRELIKTYPKKIRETLYARSLHFVFNSLVQQKVKWYQRGWFKTFLQVIGIVLTIISFGSGGFLNGMIAAIGAGLSVAATYLFNAFLKWVVIKIAILLAVEVLGEKLSAILALITAAVSYYFPDTSFNTGLIGKLTAKDLVGIATGLLQEAGNSYQSKIQELLAGFDALKDEMQSMQTELDRANALLENNNRLSPAVIMGESPEEFFYRTSHAGNIGTRIIHGVSNFHEMALALPNFQQTLSMRI